MDGWMPRGHRDRVRVSGGHLLQDLLQQDQRGGGEEAAKLEHARGEENEKKKS